MTQVLIRNERLQAPARWVKVPVSILTALVVLLKLVVAGLIIHFTSWASKTTLQEQLNANAEMDLTYPHTPDAEWRIAISRRFKHVRAESTYRTVILPVLESEGLLLECSYASDNVVEDEFWMNRVDLILELADIHILVDMERSPNMEFEFQRAARISKRRHARALRRNFGWSPMGGGPAGVGTLPGAVTIVIREGAAKDKLVPHLSKAILYFPGKTGVVDFSERF